jgi:hypothetical protein
VGTSSESHCDHVVLSFCSLRGAEGSVVTVIMMRKRGQVWLVFFCADRITVAMTDAHVARLIEAISAVSGRLR